MTDDVEFNPGCRLCPRLAAYLDDVRVRNPDYFARPVPAFGDPEARLLIVGLAPGYHGANRTGRPFTGDYAGILLYQTLHRLELASASVSESPNDGLRLKGCRITNAVKCLPPANKPVGQEIRTCNRYLAAELLALPKNAVVLALGKIAHDAVVRALGFRLSAWRFGHGEIHELPDGPPLVDSYHCSRYNTQTRRLTAAMFETVVARAAAMAGVGSVSPGISEP
ncbi:MAG: uracil-DNA glycosylase [Gammaproteobacteria bacterium]|nr:MAG: uracil-DNA glycosylase [Gammaproteobacteria bacterium]